MEMCIVFYKTLTNNKKIMIVGPNVNLIEKVTIG